MFRKILSTIWGGVLSFLLAIWNFIVSLFSSSREILVTGAVLGGLLVVSDWTGDWASQEKIGLIALASLLAGLAKFCSISLIVWVIGVAISFPNTIGKFVVKGFDEAFWSVSPRERLYISLGVVGFLTIVATLCLLL